MTLPYRTGLFISEGSSDEPLAGIVEDLFLEHDFVVALSTPDFRLLDSRVASDVESKVRAGLRLVGSDVDVIVVHRDADAVGADTRRVEIETAVAACGAEAPVVPVIPVRMTEAWLLLDEAAVRRTAGNPNGRIALNLPKCHEAERLADPKAVLKQALLAAGEVAGRRRQRLERRFDECRRLLLEGLDRSGPVRELSSWRQLGTSVEQVTARWDRTP